MRERGQERRRQEEACGKGSPALLKVSMIHLGLKILGRNILRTLWHMSSSLVYTSHEFKPNFPKENKIWWQSVFQFSKKQSYALSFCSMATFVKRIDWKGVHFINNQAISLFSYRVLMLEMSLKWIFCWFSYKEKCKCKPLFRLRVPLNQNLNGYIYTWPSGL